MNVFRLLVERNDEQRSEEEGRRRPRTDRADLLGSEHKRRVHLRTTVACFATVKHEAIQRRVPDAIASQS